jgi:hypothetical protein
MHVFWYGLHLYSLIRVRLIVRVGDLSVITDINREREISGSHGDADGFLLGCCAM